MKNFFVGFGIVIGVLFLLIVIFAAVMAFIVSSNNRDKGEYSKVLAVPDSSAPKALVVYQPTISGTGKTIAEQLAAGLNAAGYEVTITYPAAKMSADISAYSIVTFGSSVYVGQPSSVLTKYMDRIADYSGKKVALYSIGSADNTPELDVLAACIKGNGEITKTKFKAGAKDNGEIAFQFAADLTAQ